MMKFFILLSLININIFCMRAEIDAPVSSFEYVKGGGNMLVGVLVMYEALKFLQSNIGLINSDIDEFIKKARTYALEAIMGLFGYRIAMMILRGVFLTIKAGGIFNVKDMLYIGLNVKRATNIFKDTHGDYFVKEFNDMADLVFQIGPEFLYLKELKEKNGVLSSEFSKKIKEMKVKGDIKAKLMKDWFLNIQKNMKNTQAVGNKDFVKEDRDKFYKAVDINFCLNSLKRMYNNFSGVIADLSLNNSKDIKQNLDLSNVEFLSKTITVIEKDKVVELEQKVDALKPGGIMGIVKDLVSPLTRIKDIGANLVKDLVIKQGKVMLADAINPKELWGQIGNEGFIYDEKNMVELEQNLKSFMHKIITKYMGKHEAANFIENMSDEFINKQAAKYLPKEKAEEVNNKLVEEKPLGSAID